MIIRERMDTKKKRRTQQRTTAECSQQRYNGIIIGYSNVNIMKYWFKQCDKDIHISFEDVMGVFVHGYSYSKHFRYSKHIFSYNILKIKLWKCVQEIYFYFSTLWSGKNAKWNNIIIMMAKYCGLMIK